MRPGETSTAPASTVTAGLAHSYVNDILDMDLDMDLGVARIPTVIRRRKDNAFDGFRSSSPRTSPQ